MDPVSAGSVYDRTVSRQGLSSAQRCILAQIPPAATVLELGPASGYMTRELASRGCTVDAIELNASDAEKARPFCRKLVIGSVEDREVFASFTGPYDIVLMADVLEHLRTPLDTLVWATERLAPTGHGIVSLPNVAHWKVRYDLLRGRFEYRDDGVMDRTHLRFYTRESAERLFREAKLELCATITPPPKTRGRFGPLKAYTKQLLPTVFARQLVYRLKKPG